MTSVAKSSAELLPRSGLNAWLPSARGVRITLSVAVMLGSWQLLHSYVVHPLLLPSPLRVAETLWSLLGSGELLGHVVVSLKRILVGYAAGCGIGVVLGLLMGRWRAAEEFGSPFLEFLRPISPVAMVPLVLIWFGIDEMAKYFLIGYAVVIIVLFNTAFGVQSMPIIRERAATCLGASEKQIFLHVVLPSTVPYIVTGMRMALGFAFMAIVAAEMIAAESGIGFLIMQSRILIQVDQTFAGLITLSVLGAAIDLCFRLTLSRLARKYQDEIYAV